MWKPGSGLVDTDHQMVMRLEARWGQEGLTPQGAVNAHGPSESQLCPSWEVAVLWGSSSTRGAVPRRPKGCRCSCLRPAVIGAFPSPEELESGNRSLSSGLRMMSPGPGNLISHTS